MEQEDFIQSYSGKEIDKALDLTTEKISGFHIVDVMKHENVNSDVAILMIKRNINKKEAYKIWRAQKTKK